MVAASTTATLPETPSRPEPLSEALLHAGTLCKHECLTHHVDMKATPVRDDLSFIDTDSDTDNRYVGNGEVGTGVVDERDRRLGATK